MLIQIVQAVVAALICAVAVAVLTWSVRGWLVRAGIHDTPNARSSHSIVTPRGGGVAVLAVVAPGWLLAGWVIAGSLPLALVILTALVAAVSFVDDIVGLPALMRLGAQAVAVIAGVAALAPEPLLPEFLPPWLEHGLIVLAWLWFVNLYNFMDGIDGITCVETGCVAVGLGLVMLVLGADPAGIVTPWMLAGAAIGFLWWNWAPSRIFLGDVGSVQIGFALGWLLLDLTSQGALAAALILPAFYLLDATLTLILRLSRGEKVWLAHKQHAYQKAVQRGLSHAEVARRVAGVNALLIACALWAASGQPVPAGMVALVITTGLWANLRFGFGSAARAGTGDQ
jgi:UDP-N-acetylmuramyl pentapeptide phosphotransferase/UDP-N-acetylglucosamine-1-phosphate transferase